MNNPPTLEQLQGALRFKERELSIALHERKQLIIKVRRIKIEITALENRIAAFPRERVTT